MAVKVYNKLIRDKIPEIIEQDGKKCTVHVNEYGQETSFSMQENCKLLLNMLPGRSLKEY